MEIDQRTNVARSSLPSIGAEEPCLRKPKRRGTSTRGGKGVRPKRRKRSLDMLPDMPVDILYEIFGYLDPKDLLRVARTNRAFRSFLLSPAQKQLWAASLRNIHGLPACPADLTPQAYAHLLFSPFCYFCGNSGTRYAEFDCRVRCCKKCRENPDLFVVKDSEHMIDNHLLSDLLPSIDIAPFQFIPRHIWDAHVSTMEAIEAQPQEERAILREEYYEQREEVMRNLRECVPALSSWTEARQQAQEAENSERLVVRREQVLHRLAEMEDGLIAEIDAMNSDDRSRFEQTAAMRKSIPLTNRVWRNVKDELLGTIYAARMKRVRKERASPFVAFLVQFTRYLDAFAYHLSSDTILPRMADVCLHPAVRNGVIFPMVAAGQEPNHLQPFISNAIGLAIQNWRTMVDRWLRHIAWPSLPAGGVSDVEEISLEALWFTCSSCNETAIGYPQVLAHCCLRQSQTEVYPAPSSPEHDLFNAMGSVFDHNVPISFERLQALIRLDERSVQRADILSQLYGKSLATVTPHRTADCDARFACLACQIIMTWRRAVPHVCRPLPVPSELDVHDQALLVLLAPSVVSNVKSIEFKEGSRERRLYCRHCKPFEVEQYRWLGRTSRGMAVFRDHLMNTHDMTAKPVQDVDYSLTIGEALYSVDETEPVAISFETFRTKFKYDPWTLMADGAWDSSTAYFPR